MVALGGERRYNSYSFTTSALDGGEWSASRPGRAFSPGERTPGTHWTAGWVGPRAGLDTEDRGKTLCPCRGSNPDRPVVQPVVRHYTDWATRLQCRPMPAFFARRPPAIFMNKALFEMGRCTIPELLVPEFHSGTYQYCDVSEHSFL
jgi:hypothetical protein